MSKQLTTIKRPSAPTQSESAPTARPFATDHRDTAPQHGHDIRRISVFGPQFKLTVNTPGDAYEQEADAVAAQVMSAPSAEASVQREGTEDEELQMKPLDTANVQRAAPEEEELQMKPSSADVEEGADVSGVVSDGLSGGGQSLDRDTQSFMESRFGHDFSQVKIHTDTRASQSAEAVAARAYTVGGDIAFRSGEYNPSSSGGRELLAHELTHVVQQGAAAERDSSR